MKNCEETLNKCSELWLNRAGQILSCGQDLLDTRGKGYQVTGYGAVIVGMVQGVSLTYANVTGEESLSQHQIGIA